VSDVPPIPDTAAPQLARFQAAMLAALHRHDHAADVLHELRDHPDAAPYRLWLDSLQPHMLETAAALTKTWGQRT